MTPTESFEVADETLRWGQEALLELKDAFQPGGVSPYTELTDVDGKTGQLVAKLVPLKPIPMRLIARRATEAIQHAKHAIDQATHAACFSVNPSLFRETIRFPWAESPTGTETILKKGKIPPELRATFLGFEPYCRGEGYPGGDDATRHLAQIANRKHDVGIAIQPSVVGSRTGLRATDLFGPFEIPNPFGNPVNGEIEILRYTKESRFEYEYSINIDIVFDKTTKLSGKSVGGTVSLFHTKAHKILTELRQITGS